MPQRRLSQLGMQIHILFTNLNGFIMPQLDHYLLLSIYYKTSSICLANLMLELGSSKRSGNHYHNSNMTVL